jgi:hypothetical protein
MLRRGLIVVASLGLACAPPAQSHWVSVSGAGSPGRVEVDVNRVTSVGGGVTDVWFHQTYATPHKLPTGEVSSAADVHYRVSCSDHRLVMLDMIGYAPDGHQLFAGNWPFDNTKWATPDSTSSAGVGIRGYCRTVAAR